MIRQGYPHPIAYTFEADYHCPVCTENRFGVDESRFIPENARDSEGNPIGAVAPWDEWHEPGEDLPQVLGCGSCGVEIKRLDAEESPTPRNLTSEKIPARRQEER
jgi:hypothetical protein